MPLMPLIRPPAIDLFTDAAAMLNLLDLRSIMGCPGALAQYLRALFGQKENFTAYFSGKRRSLLHPNTHNDLFVPLGIRKEKLARKARVNSERVYRILLMPLGHPIILLKCNKFNMAAVSIKRSIKVAP